MKQHPRERVIRKAQSEIEWKLINLVNLHELTDGEVLQMLSSFMATQAKYMIRFERHGETETPGGIQKEGE